MKKSGVQLADEMSCFKKAMSALKNSDEKFYRAFLRSTHDTASIATLRDGRFIDVSDSLAKLIGMTREEIIGRTSIDVKFWTDSKERAEVIRELEKDGKIRDREIHYNESLGRKRTGLFQGETIEIGGVPCLISVTDDITEHKEAAQALKESEEFLLSLLVSLPTPVLVTNPDTSIKYINPAFEIMTGFSSESFIGFRPPFPWYIQKSNYKEDFENVPSVTEGPLVHEKMYRRCNGTRFWVEIHRVAIMSDNAPKYYLETWVNITDSKKLKESLEHYIQEITRVQEEERKKLSRIMHDETIQDLARLIIDTDNVISMTKVPAKARQSLENIVTKIQRIMSEIRRYAHDLRPSLLDDFGLEPAVSLLLDELEQEFGIECSFEVFDLDRLPSEVEVLLFRVVQESLRNVSKHGQSKKVSVTICCRLETVTLTVIDDGIGFKIPENLLFFVRRDKLGLMGIKERVDLAGGNLQILSELGKGTFVIVEIPAVGIRA